MWKFFLKPVEIFAFPKQDVKAFWESFSVGDKSKIYGYVQLEFLAIFVLAVSAD